MNQVARNHKIKVIKSIAITPIILAKRSLYLKNQNQRIIAPMNNQIKQLFKSKPKISRNKWYKFNKKKFPMSLKGIIKRPSIKEYL